jgi:hypothetical protein
MPRNAAAERERAVAAIQQYIAPVLANPQNDQRPLSEAAVATALRCHRATIRKYGRELIAEALRVRQAARPNGAEPRYQKLLDRIDTVTKERDDWRNQYTAILDKWLRVEWGLWQHPTVDFKALVESDIPKVLRHSPAPGRGRRREAGS